MRKIGFLIFVSLLNQISFGQASGNINYQNQISFSEHNINVGTPSNLDIVFSAKGLANIKADSFVAIFSITQVGKSTEEVNDLMEKRITQAVTELKLKKGIETFVDMISFVPVYEFEVEKKTFSKKSYNEIPKGFELKKNIHIKYSDANQLNELITILSNQEIYDLVRVDYFSSNLDNIKKEMMDKSRTTLQEKIKNYETILGTSFVNTEKRITDGFRVMLPAEMYKSYESFNSSSLNLKKSANINVADKSPTLYYQPIINKEFDFVINATILEPVIQVMYEVKLVINREKKQISANDKEYIIITPNGDMKNLNIAK